MESFWKNKCVFVTGGSGFIGTHLVKRLLKLGAIVKVVDTKMPEISHKNLSFRRVDLTKGTIDLGNYDFCFHLAAKIGGVAYFHRHPASSIRNNALMTLNLWEAARRFDVKMVYVSSSMVFERSDTFPYKEEDLTSIPFPKTGYGFSKLMGEMVCKTYNEQYGVPYAIVRPFNCYGMGELPTDEPGIAHVIPDFIKKILSGQYPLEIIGDGNQTRCFTWVEDVANGMLLAAEHGEDDDFNIGSENEVKIIDLARMLWNLCGRKEEFEAKFLPGYKYDVRRRVPDSSKIKKLGWKETVTLEEGLKKVVEWFQTVEKKG